MRKKKNRLVDEELYRLHQDIGEILSAELERMQINRGVNNQDIKRMLKLSRYQPLIF